MNEINKEDTIYDIDSMEDHLQMLKDWEKGSPKNFVIKWMITKELYDEKRYDEAIEKASEGIRGEKEDMKMKANFYRWRGLSHAKKKDYDLGIEDLKKAIEVNPEWTEHYEEGIKEIEEEKKKRGI